MLKLLKRQKESQRKQVDSIGYPTPKFGIPYPKNWYSTPPKYGIGVPQNMGIPLPQKLGKPLSQKMGYKQYKEHYKETI